MSEWGLVRFGDVAQVNPESIGKDYEPEHQFKYIDIAAVSADRGINLGGLEMHDISSAPGRARRIVRSGDTIVSTVRPNLRASAQVPPSLDGEVASTGFAVVRVGRDYCHPGFAWSVVSSDRFVASMISRCTGSNYPAIRAEDVASYEFRLPPLPEQRRIAHLMESIDAHVEALEMEIRESVTLTSAMRAESFARAVASPSTLGDHIDFASGYAFPTRYQGEPAGDFAFLKCSDMNDVYNTRAMTVANNWVSNQTLAKLRAKVWPTGTVVFPKVGAALLTEKRRILGAPSAFDNNVMGLVARDTLLPEYLLAFMEGVRLGDYAQRGAVPSINQSHVRELQVKVPSLEDQQKVVNLLSACHRQIDHLRCEVDTLRFMRSSLITALLAQTIAIPESYDELLAMQEVAA